MNIKKMKIFQDCLGGFIWQAIAEMIEKNVAVIQGNCFGFMLVPLSIGQLDNPLDYVVKAKTLMDRKKHSLESQFSFYASQFFLNLFGYKVIKFLILFNQFALEPLS